ncbi:hypothetical protein [Haladaptatus sp. DFWS20]|uniref:hypothetical protein n=1 Tax=Haladaptatus sp. DFWS20 TaxID=3403467 RepID=UPI003EC046BA
MVLIPHATPDSPSAVNASGLLGNAPQWFVKICGLGGSRGARWRISLFARARDDQNERQRMTGVGWEGVMRSCGVGTT